MKRQALVVAAFSLLFIRLFFFEYGSGTGDLVIPYDLEYFHYPLADYAFQSLRDGRIPEWDPTMYSGLPFLANVQAAFFYPPTWLMFAASYGDARMHYATMQSAVFMHVWLAFVLAWLWFRWKKLHPIAALLGAGVFSFSGYIMQQLQHFGLIAGYAWLPLGFWAVDQVDAEKRWLPAWKLVVASALCLLAGYPPFWVVFAVCMLAYALARPHPLFAFCSTAIGLGVSLLLCAVQLLPVIEASGFMVRDYRYGWGFKDPLFFISYLVPNYFDFEVGVPLETNTGYELLYLGGAGITGLVLALTSKRALERNVPAVGVLLACLFFVTNPFYLVSRVLLEWPVGAQLIRDYFFLGGITPAIAMLAAAGIHEWLGKQHRPVTWSSLAGISAGALSLLWAVRLLMLWGRDSPSLAKGSASVWDGTVAVCLFSAMVLLFARSSRRTRIGLAAAMVTLTAAEFKVFGTSKRVNAAKAGGSFVVNLFPGIDDGVYRQIAGHPEFRCVLDEGGPFSTELRHAGLTTPQGFDPLLPTNYRELIESFTKFRTDREFDLNPSDEAALHLLGVRYFITRDSTSRFEQLKANSAYELLEPSDSFFKVFELAGAQPAYGWEPPTSGEIRRTGWSPEQRKFTISSEIGGTFRLSEQYFPGWSAQIDGSPVGIERCHIALQCIDVPPGVHDIEFQYRSRSFRLGAAISLLFWTALLAALWTHSGDRLRRWSPRWTVGQVSERLTRGWWRLR